MAGEIDGDQLVLCGEPRPDRCPMPTRATGPVQQQERFALLGVGALDRVSAGKGAVEGAQNGSRTR